jgi:hypothetical protein
LAISATRIEPTKQPPIEPRPPMMMTMNTSTITSMPIAGVRLWR